MRAAFRSHHFRTATESDGDDVHVCADRFRWGPFGRIVAHLSFVVILVGATLTATGGFRNEEFAVPVGAKANVGNGTDLTVEAKSFSDSYYASGEPSDYASELVLYKNGAPVKTQEVRVNHPDALRRRHLLPVVLRPRRGDAGEGRGRPGRLRPGRAAAVRVQGRNAPHRPVLAPGAGPDGLRRRDPQSGEVDPRIAAGQTQLEVYRTGTDAPVAVRVVSQGKPARIGGVDFTFVRERQFTGLIVARDPGSTFVWIGSTLLVLGICTVFFFPHRRVRAVVRRRAGGSEVGVAAIRRRDAAFAAQFEHLVEDIRARRHPGGRNLKKEAGSMLRMSEYCVFAGIIAVILALVCYVLAFASVRVARARTALAAEAAGGDDRDDRRGRLRATSSSSARSPPGWRSAS